MRTSKRKKPNKKWICMTSGVERLDGVCVGRDICLEMYPKLVCPHNER